ncbi:MAG: hypothetical protein AAGJ29_07200 [Pseudomonadota bacterium]
MPNAFGSAQSLPMGAGRWIVGWALAFAETAEAGPWTRPSGEGYAQFAVLGQRIDGVDAVRVETYGEVGVTPKWLLTGQIEGLVFPDLDGMNQIAYRATARRQVWQRRRVLAAVEGGVVGGEAIGGTQNGCDEPGVEARVSFGGGGRTPAGRDWFFFTDAAIREHFNCRRQRLEFGYGQEVARNWFVTNKVFLETGTGDAQSAKLETVVSRRFGRNDLGLGVRQEFGGQFSETGIILSLERRF